MTRAIPPLNSADISTRPTQPQQNMWIGTRLTFGTLFDRDFSQTIEDSFIDSLASTSLGLESGLDNVYGLVKGQIRRNGERHVPNGVVMYAAGIPEIPAARRSSPKDRTFPRFPSLKTSFFIWA